ncbi:MAG: hypothetical protein HY369_03890 [Candidatus Aenigmarchaeota archaeon]|nr:hypothetical protein [Candidatus Aenigmarchaeota archaeon]
MNVQRALGIAGPVFMVAVLAAAFLQLGGPVAVSGNAVSQPAEPLPTAAGNAQRYQLGYKNYAFYFPSTGTDTLTVKKGQPVELEAVLAGPDALVGCMVSQKFPAELKIENPTQPERNLFIARQGSNVLRFTPAKEGTFTFTCGMGMGVGQIRVVA